MDKVLATALRKRQRWPLTSKTRTKRPIQFFSRQIKTQNVFSLFQEIFLGILLEKMVNKFNWKLFKISNKNSMYIRFSYQLWIHFEQKIFLFRTYWKLEWDWFARMNHWDLYTNENCRWIFVCWTSEQKSRVFIWYNFKIINIIIIDKIMAR